MANFLTNDSDAVRRGNGCNVIPEPKRQPLWKSYLEKFKDPIILILLVALVLSFLVAFYEIYTQGGGYSRLVEPLGVFLAIMLATGIAFIFEYNAEKAFRILNKAKDERKVKVLRYKDAKAERKNKHQMFLVKKSDVCVKDIVVLEAGDEVPADGIIVECNSLKMDESAFTGEMYTSKSAESDYTSDATYPTNFLLRGSIVLEGTATYCVQKVGADTEEGKGAKIVQEEESVQTPLNKQLDQLAGWITKISYVMAVLIVVGRLLYYFLSPEAGYHSAVELIEVLLSSVMIAVTLIVVAVPEGLPMSITISLALSMKKMLKQNNLVRKLHACETLGATTVICTDKTGTLTQNRMTVMESEFFDTPMQTVAVSIALNSSAEITDNEGLVQTVGNPTEGALLTWIYKDKGIKPSLLREEYEVVDRVPFSSETKCMESTVRCVADGIEMTLLKGAPELLLERCEAVAGGHTKSDVESILLKYQQKGRRTLGFAVKDGDEWTFIGVVAIADPVRPDVAEAIDTCKNKAGIRVIMVTGDVMTTACEIAQELGIIKPYELHSANNITITGPDFATMTDEQIKSEVLPYLRVMSRARPEDKARLVTLLQDTGEVVAATGDGTNDAPALKKAQVGLSMGDGTARAKEASDVTIIDNSFSSINTGVMWGRSIYMNIKRFILFQMTINVCACFIVLIGAFIGLESPLTVTQMLWVNLIMDTFAAMALSSIPADKNVMNAPPRNVNSHIIDRRMGLRIALTGGVFFVIMALLWRLLWHINADSVAEIFTLDNLKLAFNGFFIVRSADETLSPYQSGVFFTVFVLLQFWNLFNARYFKTKGSLLNDIWNMLFHREKFKESACFGCLLVAVIILAGQFCLVDVFGEFFNAKPIELSDFCLLLLYTSPVLIIPDLYRTISCIHSKKTAVTAN